MTTLPQLTSASRRSMSGIVYILRCRFVTRTAKRRRCASFKMLFLSVMCWRYGTTREGRGSRCHGISESIAATTRNLATRTCPVVPASTSGGQTIALSSGRTNQHQGKSYVSASLGSDILAESDGRSYGIARGYIVRPPPDSLDGSCSQRRLVYQQQLE